MGLLAVFPEITWLPVVLFVVGVILMAIEMVVPGFGVFGISGLILLCLSVILTAQTFWQALILIAIIACVLGVLFAVLVLLASTGNMPKGLVLRASARRELGYSSAPERLYQYLGKSGTALSPLRPAGSIDCDGTRLDVVTRGEFIDKGASVVVIEVVGNRVVVKVADNS